MKTLFIAINLLQYTMILLFLLTEVQEVICAS